MKKDSFYNKYGFLFFLGTLFFSSLWVLYFMFFNNSIDLGELEVSGASKVATEGNLTEEDKKIPWLSSESLIQHGRKIYKTQCALCHGEKGLGDGSPGLVPAPRNLVEGKWKQGGSSKALFLTLEKGVPGSSMVSFKHLPKIDRWALVHYMRSLTKNKVPDDSKKLEEFAKTAL